VQYVQCLYKEKDTQEGGHFQDKERGLRRNQPSGHMDPRLLTFKTMGKSICIVEDNQPVVFSYGSPSELMQYS
jgi:hypothetical protein